jgi:hypothetical protein
MLLLPKITRRAACKTDGTVAWEYRSLALGVVLLLSICVIWGKSKSSLILKFLTSIVRLGEQALPSLP